MDVPVISYLYNCGHILLHVPPLGTINVLPMQVIIDHMHCQ